MSYVDALSRINQIEQQISELQGGSLASTAGSTAAAGAGSIDDAGGATTSPLPQRTSPTRWHRRRARAAASSLLGSAASSGIDTGTSLPSTLLSGSAPLERYRRRRDRIGDAAGQRASSMLTSAQQQFASRLAADTGLDPWA